MQIKLDPAKAPVKVRPRRYPASQRVFLNKYVDELENMGFIKINPDAEWQAAPHIVPKSSSKAKFRMVIDIRPLNDATIKLAWPMPHLDSEMQDFKGASCFAVLDFVSGYWQLPLDPESVNLCGIITPKGTYSSLRVLQGLTNAAAHFQSVIEPLFAEMRSNMKAWLDDFNLFAKCEDQLISLLSQFFGICKRFNLFLSAKKCCFFAETIKWCGREIDAQGYRLDPTRSEALRKMHLPTKAGELCEFIHCLRWMSISIPSFSKRVSLLNEVLEEAYKVAGRRTKRAIKNIPLFKLSWGHIHNRVFLELQESLKNAIKLVHPDKEKIICVHTDASDRFWSGVVTQIHQKDLEIKICQQNHEPLGFVGGEFTKHELNWSTYEKEGFAIFRTFEKLDYLMLGEQSVHVFTDHRNLLYVFAPCALIPTTGRHIVSKVQRWAMYLSRFKYVIEHIDGERNIFADILTRWTRGYRLNEIPVLKIQSLVQIADQVVPSAVDIVWPTTQSLLASQTKSVNKPTKFLKDECGLIYVNGRIWIPREDSEMRMKIIVASHCGSMGHRGVDSTASIIRENFQWIGLLQDVKDFLKACLHCLVARSGEIIPRPHANTIHAQRTNEVIHCDYLYMGPSLGTNLQYVLIIRDDLSSYVWLWPTNSASGDAAAEVIATWIGQFGCFEWLVTDQGTHFKNTLFKGIMKETKAKHHFTTAYCPWSNGSVERVCQEVIRATKAVTHELLISPKHWPAVLECVQSILNQSPLRRLGLRDKETPGVFRTPLEVFTTMKPNRPLLRALPIRKYAHCKSIDHIRALQLIEIDKIQSKIEEIHRDVEKNISASRQKSINTHNARTNVLPINFGKGDFVLLRKAQPGGHKLSYKWIGVYRVVEAISSHVFEIENLFTKRLERAHARRLMFYRADMDGKEVTKELLRYVEHCATTYQTVLKITDIRETEGKIQIEIEWEGLPDREDRTWEELGNMKEHIPGLLHDFLGSAEKRDLKRRALADLNIT